MNVIRGKTPIEYPWIGEDNGLVVLFSSAGVGTVLSGGGGRDSPSIGAYGMYWNIFLTNIIRRMRRKTIIAGILFLERM